MQLEQNDVTVSFDWEAGGEKDATDGTILIMVNCYIVLMEKHMLE
jgi:hypothetical protein